MSFDATLRNMITVKPRTHL